MAYGFSGGGFRPRKPFNAPRSPVREGEELDVMIESVGEKGDGIAKVKGFVIFVPNTKENDAVRIKVTKVLSKVGFGEVIGKAQPAKIQQTKPVEKAKPAEKKEVAKAKKPRKKKADEEVSDLKADEPTEKEEKPSLEFENEDDIEEGEDEEGKSSEGEME